MIKSICILTQSHLCRNPRVVKEAKTLADAGYEVSILTTFAFKNLLKEDKTLIDTLKINYQGVVNLIPGSNSKWNIFKAKLIKRIASELVRLLNIQTPLSLSYDFIRNYKAAKKINADLYICHQEASTVIGYKLLKQGKKVAFDFEDWYSHDLLESANKYRPIKLLQKVEKYALQHATLSYTTSKAMATAMAKYAKSEEPKVLYNVFPWEERKLIDNKTCDRIDLTKVSMHWFSQTIGPGRGIEFIIKTLKDVNIPLELHLRGNCSEAYKNELLNIFPTHKGHELFIHTLVPHKELLSRISEHDIGLAIEKSSPESRDLTITNKILQSLLAGVAVIASDTKGQIEVMEQALSAVSIFRNNDTDDLLETINRMISQKNEISKAKKKALQIARNIFCWEEQEKYLVEWIKEIEK